MEFDKTRFVTDAAEAHMGAPDRPLEALLDALGDNLAALHAEIAALKAMTTPEPQRETGWVVVMCKRPDVLTRKWGVRGLLHAATDKDDDGRPMWFRLRTTAENVCASVGDCRHALLYKDTLEEV